MGAIFTLISCGGGGSSSSSEATPTPNPSVNASTFVLSANIPVLVEENSNELMLGYSLSGTFSGSIQYELVPTGDYENFILDSNSGSLEFVSLPNFEQALDLDIDNNYEVTIRAAASLGGGVSEFSTVIRVTDIDEIPELLGSKEIRVLEDAIDVTQLNTSEGDGALEITISTEKRDGLYFIISENNVLRFRDPLNFEDPRDENDDNRYEITLDIFDNGILEAQEQVTVVLVDVLETQEQPVVAVEGTLGVAFRARAYSNVTGYFPLSISGGEDQELFQINEDTQVLEFIDQPQLSSPSDENSDSIYEVTLFGESADGLSWTGNLMIALNKQAPFSIEMFMPYSEEIPIRVDAYDEFIVSGRLLDENGSPVDATQLVRFEANGSEVTYDDETGHFYGSVSIAETETTVQVIAENINGEIVIATRYLLSENNITIPYYASIAFDSIQQRLLFSKGRSQGNVGMLDLTTQQIVPGFEAPDELSGAIFDFAVDEINHQVYMATSFNQLWRFSLSNDEWEFLSEYSIEDLPFLEEGLNSITFNPLTNQLYLLGDEILDEDIGRQAYIYAYSISGDEYELLDRDSDLKGAEDIAYDSSQGKILMTDLETDGILSMDPDTGVVTEFSVPSPLDFGPRELEFPERLIVDEDNNQAWVVEAGNHIYGMELDTGILIGYPVGEDDFFTITDIADDTVNNRLIALDSFRNLVMEVDKVTGERTTLFGSNVGDGAFLFRPSVLALDTQGQKAYVALDDEIIEVDIKNGSRRVLSGLTGSPLTTHGDGPYMDIIESIVIDKTNERLIVSIIGNDAVITVDLETGNREYLASSRGLNPLVGEGIIIPAVVDMVLDNQSDMLVAVDITSNALFTIDLDNGDRTILSGEELGSGDLFVDPMAVEVDFEQEIAYVFDSTLESLFQVDMISGDREILPLSEYIPELNDTFLLYFDHVDLELDKNKQILYISFAQNNVRLKIDLVDLSVEDVFSSFSYVTGVTALEIDFERELAYQLDYSDHSLWRSDMKTGEKIKVSH